VKELFEEWLRSHVPDRAEKVLNRIRDLRGGKLNDWWVSNTFRHYRQLARIRKSIHFHSLRHTCASWLAEQGTSIQVIQAILRHTNIRQSMRYSHLLPDAVRLAVQVGDLTTADSITVRGRDLAGEVMGVLSFADLAFLLAAARPPTEDESRLFNAVLVSLALPALVAAALPASAWSPWGWTCAAVATAFAALVAGRTLPHMARRLGDRLGLPFTVESGVLRVVPRRGLPAGAAGVMPRDRDPSAEHLGRDDGAVVRGRRHRPRGGLGAPRPVVDVRGLGGCPAAPPARGVGVPERGAGRTLAVDRCVPPGGGPGVGGLPGRRTGRRAPQGDRPRRDIPG
jgi:hypothetical protein